MPNLAKIADCTGCGACVAACRMKLISLVEDSEGFGYPTLEHPELCENCSLCEKTCPVLTPLKHCSDRPTAFAAYIKDKAIRCKSSSGGVFSELATYILAQAGVVFGAAYDEEFDVHHICVENIDELACLRGAKYSQSKLGPTYQNIQRYLMSGRKVLFSGTPCQVAGLKSFLHKEYENLICIDFVCHGVPSPMAWKAYVTFRARSDNDGQLPQSINLRSKETGWSRYRYSNVFEYKNGKRYLCPSGDSLFMKLFVGDYICRPSCENCSFKGYSRISDLTLGDFWGIWNISPEMDDDSGTSLILCQSNHGAELLNNISDKIVMKQVTLEEASRQNKSILTASPANPRRREAMEIIRAGNISICEAWFHQPKESIVKKLRHMAGNMLRKCL